MTSHSERRSNATRAPFAKLVLLRVGQFALQFSAAACDLGLVRGACVAIRAIPERRKLLVRQFGDGYETGLRLSSRTRYRALLIPANKFAQHLQMGVRYPVRWSNDEHAFVVNLANGQAA